MEFIFDYFWIIVIFVVLVGLYFSYLYERNRTEALALIAKKLGFSFAKSGRQNTKSKHEHFELFSKGHSKTVKNEMWGNDQDNTFSIFGYRYTQGHGKNSSTYHQTILSIECADLNAPKFELKPENAMHKIGQIFGYQDIDFESYPTFSKKYLLRGEDETKIRAFFSPQLIKYFEQTSDVCIEVNENSMIFYRLSQRCDPEEIETFYQEGKQIMSNLVNLK